MTRRSRSTLEPDIERELAALDAALAGEPLVEADLDDLAIVVSTVRDQRARPAADFVGSLDERVARGFVREASSEARRARVTPRRRRMLMPALGAAASLALIVVVGVSLLGGDSNDGGTVSSAVSPPGAVQRETKAAPGGVVSTSPSDGAGSSDALSGTLPSRRARRVERQASVALTTAPDKVGAVSDGVVRVTDSVRGVVVTSSVSSTDSSQGGANFELRVPTDRLPTALAELSKLAHVRSRTQSSQDVTSTFVSAQDRLEQSNAERRSLLKQLANATTDNQTQSIRARLRIARAAIASARGDLRQLRERTDYSAVTVTVETGDGASGGTGGGPWTPKDALGDAVRILELVAGGLLIVLALALPVAFVGAGAMFAGRLLRRRRREQTLDAI